ncbi:MAG: hypothetical protein HN341_03265 [Verrucomicrobia bacterium]|jgi:hypothetical protein|nr:hypothetical protein [Verrucomicrobiota bacterium]
MNVILRKIRNAPSRFRSIFRETRFIAGGVVEAAHEAVLIARRLRNSRIEGEKVAGTVVINSAWSRPVADIELYLAHILAMKGLTVHVLFDDGVLEYWDGVQFQAMKCYSPYRARWCIRARHALRKRLVWWAYKTPDMHRIDYSTMVKQVPPDATVLDDDIPHALSSTKRFYQTGVIDTQGEPRAFYEKSLRNCAISHAVGKYVVERLKPDLYITSHGIYSVWGPAYRMLRDAGVPIVVWQVPGTTAGHIRLIDRQDAVLASTNDWKEFDTTTPMTAEILERGQALLEARINHRTQDTKEYFGGRVDKAMHENVAAPLNRAVTFGMFPNVAWDGDTPERNIMFDNVVDWCEFTVNAIRGTSHHLYIRFHPSEVTRLKGSVKLEDIMRQKVPDLDCIPNLTLIGSGEPLDTYAFAREHVDVGLIYDGTLSLELTHLGIPVIACTNGNFTPETIVYQPTSREQLSQWIDDPLEVLGKFKEERRARMSAAAKYAFWLFNESLLAFKPLEVPYPAEIDYSLVREDEPLSDDEARISDRLIKPLRDSSINAAGIVARQEEKFSNAQ